MGESAGLTTMQLACSLFMHVVLLLPLLAMPVTSAESRGWRLEDYVIYLMLKSPSSAPGTAAVQRKDANRAAGRIHAKPSSPPVPLPVEKHAAPPAPPADLQGRIAGVGVPADGPAAVPKQGLSEEYGSADTVKKETIRSVDSPSEEITRSEVLPAERSVETKTSTKEEAFIPLPDAPGPEDFFDAASPAPSTVPESSVASTMAVEVTAEAEKPEPAVRPDASLPTPSQTSESDAIPVPRQQVIIPLPDAPAVSSFFAARRGPILMASVSAPSPARTAEADSSPEIGKGSEAKTRSPRKQEAPGAAIKSTIHELIGNAAALPFPPQGTRYGKVAPFQAPGIDLTRTPGSFLPDRAVLSAAATKPEGDAAGPADVGGRGIAPPTLPVQAGEETSAAAAPLPGPEKERPDVRLPALPLAVYIPLKIEISCAKDCPRELSMLLLKKRYPAEGKRDDKATGVHMNEETIRSDPGERRILSAADAGRGTYAFRIVNMGQAADLLDISFLFSDESKIVRVKQYKSVSLAPGGKATYRFIIPDAIFWDDEDRFGGTIEDSDSITKFNDETGLVWREEKDY